MKKKAMVLALLAVLTGCKGSGGTYTGGGSLAGGGGGGGGCSLSGTINGTPKTFNSGCICNYQISTNMLFIEGTSGTESLSLAFNSPAAGQTRTSAPPYVEYSPSLGTNFSSNNGGTFSITMNTWTGNTDGNTTTGIFSGSNLATSPASTTANVTNGSWSCAIDAY